MTEQSESLRGVIDRLEGAWAVLALDDQQQLNWPREHLPASAHVGAAVILRRESDPDRGRSDPVGTFRGRVCYRGPGPCLVIRLGPQRLIWPTEKQLLSGDAIALRLDLDPADTTRRRQQVQSLIDDLFR